VDQCSPRRVCGGLRVLGPNFLSFIVPVSYHSTSAQVCLRIVRDRHILHVNGYNIKIGGT